MRRSLTLAAVGLGLVTLGCDVEPLASMNGGDPIGNAIDAGSSTPGPQTGSQGSGGLALYGLALTGDDRIGNAIATGPEATTPQYWSQHQGGSAHSGAKLIETLNALTDNLKWEVDVGRPL